MKSFLRRLTATALANATANPALPGSNTSWLGKQVRDGRKEHNQEETTEPSRDGGPGTGAPSLVSLCHGADHPADPPAVCRRGVVLERGCALQYFADAASPGGQKGRCLRRRHPARILHHHRD